ncbi:MAG: TadG family pilus assembly protein [Hyphomicrobium sp.]|nr:TadG family pilus assembly protein [Hyphomicrobium sp.]
MKAFSTDRSGTIAIISATAIASMMAVAALAVDIGSLYLERRQAQGAVDLAAMAAAADVNRAETAARATLEANGLKDFKSFKVETGLYTPDPGLPVEQRFQVGAEPANAARVTIVRPGQLYFAKLFTSQDVDVGVTGLGTNVATAAFTAGTRLAAIRGGLTNKILGGLLGGNVELELMDYEALADADLSLLSFMDALAVQTDVTAGTYDQVLTSDVSAGDVLTAAADVAEASDQATAAAAMRLLRSSTASSSTTVDLSKVIDLGPLAKASIGQPPPGLDVTLDALGLVTASAVAANGERQLAIDLGIHVPGLAGLKLDIAIGEPPASSGWATVGSVNATVRTAQMRMKLTADVLGTGALAGARVRLPIYVSMATATATLTDVTCVGNEGTVTIAATPGVAHAWIGETQSDFDDFTSELRVQKAVLVQTPLARVIGSAHVGIENDHAEELVFTPDDIENGTVHRAETSSFIKSAVSSLLRDLDVDVVALGLSLPVRSTLTSAVASVLEPVAAPLDAVVYSILSTVGAHLGEVDVRVNGVRCGGASQLAG